MPCIIRVSLWTNHRKGLYWINYIVQISTHGVASLDIGLLDNKKYICYSLQLQQMASNAWGHFAVSPTPVGGYDCKFVDPPPDKLVCQICLLVARIPHQVMCCGRVYCKACLDEHKKHSYTCPNCRKVGQNFPDIRGE